MELEGGSLQPAASSSLVLRHCAPPQRRCPHALCAGVHQHLAYSHLLCGGWVVGGGWWVGNVCVWWVAVVPLCPPTPHTTHSNMDSCAHTAYSMVQNLQVSHYGIQVSHSSHSAKLASFALWSTQHPLRHLPAGVECALVWP